MSISIRARLTLWYATLAAAALVAFSAGVLWLHARWAQVQFDSELSGLGTAVSQAMHEELDETDSLHKAAVEANESTDVPNRSIAILDAYDRPLAAHWHGLSPDAISSLNRDARINVTALQSGNQDWRVLLRRESSPFGEYNILVAGPLRPLESERRLLLNVLLVVTPLLVLATAGVAWYVASSALRPLSSMAAQATRLNAQSVGWRLTTPMTRDEVDELAQSFNHLLNRLETASATQRQFMADASHEMRTPVSVIQTAAEVTLQRTSRDEAEYRDALTIVTEQSIRLSRMVEDMLVLARADAGGYRLTRAALYVDEIVADCVKAASVVAASRHIQLRAEIAGDVSTNGDEHLLNQLVANLLSNAVQHTPAGGTIAVALTREAATCVITVSDTGPGIPAADRERVFQRFVRLDPARSGGSGAGLGLPIARWIAEQHGGTIAVDEHLPHGCIFTVRLPIDAASASNATSSSASPT
jgi:heavy metal sensor kinase